jgi:hypothetical protein
MYKKKYAPYLSGQGLKLFPSPSDRGTLTDDKHTQRRRMYRRVNDAWEFLILHSSVNISGAATYVLVD